MAEVDVDQHMRDLQKEYLDFLDDDVIITKNYCYSFFDQFISCAFFSKKLFLFCFGY